MNSAEFRILRRALGLTHHDIATAMNVSERSARRWEYTHQPPEEAARFLEEAYGNNMDRIAEQLDKHAHRVVPIPTYTHDDDTLANWGLSLREYEAYAAQLIMVCRDRGVEYEVLPAE